MRQVRETRKLATAALSFSGAVYLSHYLLPRGLWIATAGTLALISIALAFALRGEVRLRALLIGIAASLGLCVCSIHYEMYNAAAAELTGTERIISAELLDYPRVEETYSSLEMKLIGEELPHLKAYMYSYDFDLSALKPGDIIEINARLRASDMRRGEAYDRYNAEGVYLLATATSEPRLVRESPLSFMRLLRSFARAVESIAQTVFSERTGALMTALLTGNKSQLYDDERLYADMSRAGILHIVAVSGMHVAFLVGFIKSLVRRKRPAALLAIIAVWLFVPVAGSSPSVVRAAFMQSTVLAAPLLRRENDAITSLSTILALLLLINPDACASVSLQLSILAMLGILLVTPRVYAGLIGGKRSKKLLCASRPARAAGKALIGVCASFSATVGALIFSTPVAVLHFGYISIIGIAVNIVIFWLVSACFILGYAACLLGLLWLPLGELLGAPVSFLSGLIIYVVELAAKLPYSAVYTSGTVFGRWLILVYIIFGVCYVFRRKSGFRPTLPVCLSLCSLCALIVFTEIRLLMQPARVTVLDVGQGQSIIAVHGRETVLIDCGGKGETNAGELAAAKLLGEGRRSVDVLALTHLDDDHVNGVLRLISRVNVKTLLLPPRDDEHGEDWDIITRFARESGAEVDIIYDDARCTVGAMSLEIYAVLSGREPGLIYLWSDADAQMLITGDASAAEERRFLKTHKLPEVELYVVGHHGSKHSSCEELLSALSAEKAVISSGYNTYGHPAPETLERLCCAGMEIYRTDESGNISFVFE